MADLTDLPREILHLILKMLDAQDRFHFYEAFSAISPDIAGQVSHPSLWAKVRLQVLYGRKCLRFLNEQTVSVTIFGAETPASGDKKKQKKTKPDPKTLLVPESLMTGLARRCPNLTELRLVNCRVDAARVGPALFPRSLEAVAYQGVELINRPGLAGVAASASPFFRVADHLPRLRRLTVADPVGAGWTVADSRATLTGHSRFVPSLAAVGKNMVSFRFIREGEGCRDGGGDDACETTKRDRVKNIIAQLHRR